MRVCIAQLQSEMVSLTVCRAFCHVFLMIASLIVLARMCARMHHNLAKPNACQQDGTLSCASIGRQYCVHRSQRIGCSFAWERTTGSPQCPPANL